MFTGLSREAARFQARSAFTGVGYTTRESESIVNHPVRRRIVMMLMLMGNVGVATVVATVMVSLSSSIGESLRYQVLVAIVLTVGLLALWGISSSRIVERQLNKVIGRALKKFTDLDTRDYVSLLQLADGYSVFEMRIDSKHWLVGKSLRELRLSDEGILVLGIHRTDGIYQGIPRAQDMVSAKDTVILYGNKQAIRRLDRRQAGVAGDQEHAEHVTRLDEVKKSEPQSAVGPPS
ncbi:potassium/proton antiporter [Aureliella helgolandensis]|uniref:Potassium/proton antiporter n=2 Tax=Aureliella helgolandensis TaxID=2527968 RepID=A0A518GH93_9BACT|nr:potassium/proton antiporter [Aureliella helgolandensis]